MTNTRRILAATVLVVVMCAGAYLQAARGKWFMATASLAIAAYALRDTWKTWNSPQ